MIDIRVKSDNDPRDLAELIAQAHGTAEVDVRLAKHVGVVRAELARERPSRQEIETVNFQRLDTDNDWSDI